MFATRNSHFVLLRLSNSSTRASATRQPKVSLLRLMRTFSTRATVLEVYGFGLSQPTRSILHLLNIGEIPYKFFQVNALVGENRKKDFLNINPAGLVPCIRAPELEASLGESAAILQYLSETRVPALYSTDPIVRARINFWLHWHHGNSRMWYEHGHPNVD